MRKRLLTSILLGAILAGAKNPLKLNPTIPTNFPSITTRGISGENSLENSVDTGIEERKDLIEKFAGYKETQKKIASEIIFENRMNETDWIYNSITSLRRIHGIEDDSPLTKKYLRSIIKIESTDNPSAVSPAGATGLMQVIEETWYLVVGKKISYKRAKEPWLNMDVGIRHLIDIEEKLSDVYPGWKKLNNDKKREIISICYNGGLLHFQSHNWNLKAMWKETQDYIVKIANMMNYYDSMQKVFTNEYFDN